MKMEYLKARCTSARRALQSKLSSAPNFTPCRSRTSGMISSVLESFQESCLWKLLINPSEWLWKRNPAVYYRIGWQWESIRRLLCCKGQALLDTLVSDHEFLQLVEDNPRPAEAPISPYRCAYLVFNDLFTGKQIVGTSHELYDIMKYIVRVHWFVQRREVGNQYSHFEYAGGPLDESMEVDIDDLEVSSPRELYLLQNFATTVNRLENREAFQVRFALMQSEPNADSISDGGTTETWFARLKYSIESLRVHHACYRGLRCLDLRNRYPFAAPTNGNILSGTQEEPPQVSVAIVEDPDRQHLPESSSRLNRLVTYGNVGQPSRWEISELDDASQEASESSVRPREVSDIENTEPEKTLQTNSGGLEDLTSSMHRQVPEVETVAIGHPEKTLERRSSWPLTKYDQSTIY